ncbi:hypothetical protein C8Q77DRAFT_481238 [Trametes polyzona]|nr:hypothetical protein C8Q77DRAFT_481238 [Trametes polyzona]
MGELRVAHQAGRTLRRPRVSARAVEAVHTEHAHSRVWRRRREAAGGLSQIA